MDIHDIDEQPDNKEIFRILRELEPQAVIREQGSEAKPAAQPQTAPAGRPQSVVLYCRPGCIDCRLARRFLERNGVRLHRGQRPRDAGAEARVRQWTGGALISPVFDIDGRIVIDFNRSALMEALGLE